MARRHREAWVICAGLTACHRSQPAPSPTDRVVAATRDAFEIDGELNEPDWNRLGDPQAFTFEDHEARPYSQIRLLHDADHLYVGLYAADQDIRSTEHFDLTIGSLQLSVDPLGRVTAAIPGVRSGKDADGTIDQPTDEDEEWVIELAIPLGATGLRDAPAPARASRCDTTKDGVARCGTWSARLRLGE